MNEQAHIERGSVLHRWLALRERLLVGRVTWLQLGAELARLTAAAARGVVVSRLRQGDSVRKRDNA